MLFFYKVKGNSMLPTLKGGDFVVATLLYSQINIDDLLVINHSRYGKIIKRVTTITEDKTIHVSGDNNESLSSAQIGPITRSQVQGKILFSIKQK